MDMRELTNDPRGDRTRSSSASGRWTEDRAAKRDRIRLLLASVRIGSVRAIARACKGRAAGVVQSIPSVVRVCVRERGAASFASSFAFTNRTRERYKKKRNII